MPKIHEQVNDIWKLFYGEDGKSGIVRDIDRNTQHRIANQRWKWLLLPVLVASLLTAVLALVQ